MFQGCRTIFAGTDRQENEITELFSSLDSTKKEVQKVANLFQVIKGTFVNGSSPGSSCLSSFMLATKPQEYPENSRIPGPQGMPRLPAYYYSSSLLKVYFGLTRDS